MYWKPKSIQWSIINVYNFKNRPTCSSIHIFWNFEIYLKIFLTFFDGIIKVHDNMKIRLEKIRFYKLKLSISFGR